MAETRIIVASPIFFLALFCIYIYMCLLFNHFLSFTILRCLVGGERHNLILRLQFNPRWEYDRTRRMVEDHSVTDRTLAPSFWGQVRCFYLYER